MIYNFTLALSNITIENFEDVLYKAGCSDALINYKNKTYYLDFTRKGNSLIAAVGSAMKEIRTITNNEIILIKYSIEKDKDKLDSFDWFLLLIGVILVFYGVYHLFII